MKVGFQVAQPAGQLLVGLEAVFGLLALLEDFLGLFLVLPEIRLAYFRFQAGEDFAVVADVKDSSARARCAASVLRNDVRGLRESYFSP